MFVPGCIVRRLESSAQSSGAGPAPRSGAGSGVFGFYVSLVRVLVTTQPAYGHLHPLVPAARALADAGHEVLLASSASFQTQLTATGLPTITAGLDWLESEVEVAFQASSSHPGAHIEGVRDWGGVLSSHCPTDGR
jgi:hypothetical protein